MALFKRKFFNIDGKEVELYYRIDSAQTDAELEQSIRDMQRIINTSSKSKRKNVKMVRKPRPSYASLHRI
jgi:tRNA C32,U32 (ribose-2'-O)-methylase TrmJ